ncbi:MAG: Smr/MutS family protein [Chitinophagales bacterium]
MKFQIGDKVIIQHSHEEGEVVDIIDHKMVMVDVRGVKFPAYIDQLDFPYFKRFTEKKKNNPSPKKNIDEIPVEKNQKIRKEADGVWLAFLPVFDIDEYGEDIVQTLKVYLVNHTLQGYQFDYHLLRSGKSDFELQNQVFNFQEFYLHDIPFEDLNDNPSFNLQFSLITKDNKKADQLDCSLKLRAKQVFLQIEKMKEKAGATFSYKLFDQYPDKPKQEKNLFIPKSSPGQKIKDASRPGQWLEPARQEVDLHIEKITDDWKSLSNFEILSLQLQTFEKWLDLALVHRQLSMIVIHGLGTGKLRDEIHEILRLKKEVRSFVNQYHPLYGYGATEIFFQYK